jgi:AraC-like DNA-binding protein
MLTMISEILIFLLRALGIVATAKRAHASEAQTYRKFSKISGKFFFNFELRRSAEAGANSGIAESPADCPGRRAAPL